MDRLLERERKLRELNAQLDAKKNRAESRAQQVIDEQESYFQRLAETPFGLMDEPEVDGGSSSSVVQSQPQPQSQSQSQSQSQPRVGRVERTPLRVSATPSTAAVFATATPGSPVVGGGRIGASGPGSPVSPGRGGTEGPSPATVAQISLLTRELRAMQERMEALMEENAQKDRALAETEEELRVALEENKRAGRAEHNLKQAAAKSKKIAEEARRKAHAHALKVSSLQAELDRTLVDQRTNATKATSADVRLNRALEEAERAKAALKDVKTQLREVNAKATRDLADRDLALKRANKQKAELMAAFKKQLKLIDLLKRQKLHIEAAKALNFTEDEFARVLSLGELSLRSGSSA